MDMKESNLFEKSNSQLGSKSTELGIDFMSFDVQLDKHLAKIWSKEREIQEEWEIDLTKLDIKNVIADHGTVYKGVYDDQDVAVKVLDWSDGGGITAAQAFALRGTFEREVAVWYKLDHPNITKFIGASVGILKLKIPSDNDLNTGQKPLPYRACCVVVEYLQGGTVKNFLIRNSRKKLSFKVVIQFALDLSRGLSYLHSKKIVHGDVKTENMLLDTDGTLKIADFRVARVKARNCRDMTSETGTLGYMALEVLAGKPYNRKCVVYSFGICLWEIYCCDIPYADLSFDEVSSGVIHQVP
ncbi:serine/threonine-protein kinase 54-like [Bidens hawaiensis]|uniref:serine/threonine-protein kinase 54-like n=1 Tax=Bidens hawaiensis TaxID=980011 RepID=UPI00404A8E08